MTKRDQAYELFNQSKTKDNPQVKALGLKEESLRRYYREWNKLQAGEVLAVEVPAVMPPPVVPSEVQLDSLRIRAKFELGGQQYMAKEKVEGMVVCYNLFLNDTMTLGGSTMVKPI